jgi:hypothetical protein
MMLNGEIVHRCSKVLDEMGKPAGISPGKSLSQFVWQNGVPSNTGGCIKISIQLDVLWDLIFDMYSSTPPIMT